MGGSVVVFTMYGNVIAISLATPFIRSLINFKISRAK